MAKTTEKKGRDVYAPTEAFAATIDGKDYSFTPQTYVREGHPALKQFPHLFQPLHVHHEA